MPSDPIDTNDTAANREQSVGTFYDDNTNLFLKLGQHGESAGIHQPLYPRQDMALSEAIHTQHDIILARLTTRADPIHLVDLGCGVGASMIYIAAHTDPDVTLTGLTISAKQVDIGLSNIEKLSLKDRVSIRLNSYLEIPEDIQHVDTAYAIESFIHTSNAHRFFSEVSRILKPGAELVLFDDFLKTPLESIRDKGIIEDFRLGWKANALYTIEEMSSLARKYNMELAVQVDHTSHLDLWRTRDKLIATLAPVARVFAGISNYATFLVGGNARQQAFRQNILAYMQLIFVKR